MTTEKLTEAAKELKEAAGKLKAQTANAKGALADAAHSVEDAAEHVVDAVAHEDDDKDVRPDFSFKSSLKTIVALPIGMALGWLVVSATGGLGFEAKEAKAAAASLVANTQTVDPVAEEARRVASETAQRVATRVSTDVATRVARDVASRVARETALKAIENVQ